MKWVLIAIMVAVVLRLGWRLRDHEWTARRGSLPSEDAGVPRSESWSESRAESPRGEYAGEYVSEYVGEHRRTLNDIDHGAENLIVEMY